MGKIMLCRMEILCIFASMFNHQSKSKINIYVKFFYRADCQHCAGEIEGNPNEMIYKFGKIETATSGEITFLANLKYEAFLYTTKASCVLIPKDYVLNRSIKTNLIRVNNPYDALIILLAKYQKQQANAINGIHKKQ